MKIKEENPKADTNELENEIDKLVYELYELTAAEIEIIEESVKTWKIKKKMPKNQKFVRNIKQIMCEKYCKSHKPGSIFYRRQIICKLYFKIWAIIMHKSQQSQNTISFVIIVIFQTRLTKRSLSVNIFRFLVVPDKKK